MSDAPATDTPPPDSGLSKPPDQIVERQTPLQSGVEKLAARGGNSLVEMLSMTASMGGNPLHQKMNAEHITQVLTLAEKHDEREYDLSKRQQDKDSTDGRWGQVLHAIYFCHCGDACLRSLRVQESAGRPRPNPKRTRWWGRGFFWRGWVRQKNSKMTLPI